jgi:GT2 family glycosyltransferase
MTKNPMVYVITGTHNNLDYSLRMLKCFQKQTYKNILVYFVDDGSSKDLKEKILINYPHTIILKGNGNLWWTGVLNTGLIEILKIANMEDYILTMNVDCVFDKNYVETLVNEGIKLNKSIVGSSVYDIKYKDKLIDAGVEINWFLGQFQTRNYRHQKLIRLDTVSTKGTLFPIQVFKKNGSFDSYHFPHYLSDFDFGLRARLAGFTLKMSKNAKVFNEIENTGIGEKLLKTHSIHNAFQILFSRKSKRNIIDHFWFITKFCPWYLKAWNYVLLLGKSLYIIFFSIW